MNNEELLESSALFDADWYCARYPDVQALTLTPQQHFLKYGWRLGRDPGPEFSTRAYQKQYPDIAKADLNPLLHYVRHGQKEGRQIQKAKEQASQLLPAIHSIPRDVPPEPPRETLPDDPNKRTERQLAHTQQLLEHYYNRSRELEFQMQGA
ncbi:hypothetical protein [Halomonas piscis]|uniref:hypothetical protein n=1 Tax=Halomonas piscis TaxID=3031727 RepID=UPI0028A1A933|nr:hypothetical protein [Halomonas piscis]